MLRKYFCIFLSALMVTALAGCGSNAADDTSEETTQPQTESSNEQETEISAAVVYFSATGNTEAVAELIAAETGADIFEIVPEVEYTAEDLNYSDDSCRANQEMDDDAARPAISSDLSAVTEYDVIFLGHPIWWGTAPRIIQTFLESYDLSQAEIYTFCTSGSSGIDQSIADLQSLYPDIDIVSGRRFSDASQEEVREWLDELDITEGASSADTLTTNGGAQISLSALEYRTDDANAPEVFYLSDISDHRLDS